MMIDAMTKLATEESNMARTRRRIYRHDDVGTFGGRLKAERKAKELYQNDMVEKLAQHGINRLVSLCTRRSATDDRHL